MASLHCHLAVRCRTYCADLSTQMLDLLISARTCCLMLTVAVAYKTESPLTLSVLQRVRRALLDNVQPILVYVLLAWSTNVCTMGKHTN